MLWIINGLIYGFFTALYTLFNQHYRLNGYILGIWRGFGICLVCLPAVFFARPQSNAYYWILLISQGLMIGIYDSRLFFASAEYGAGATSRFMSIVALVTTFIWWLITPDEFLQLLNNGTVFITLLLALFGFSFCYWQMVQSQISRRIAVYVLPAVFALAGMSIITKAIAMHSNSVWTALAYYLTVSTFISGTYNAAMFIKTEKPSFAEFFKRVFAPKVIKSGFYLVSFSLMLITSKTLALRVAPNPGYVVALLLVAPIFVFALNQSHKIPDDISVREGFAMIFFLALLMVLVNGKFGITD